MNSDHPVQGQREDASQNVEALPEPGDMTSLGDCRAAEAVLRISVHVSVVS